MRPVDWKELKKICEANRCRHDRTKGDHYVMVRDGMARPIVIPMKKGLKEDIVLGIAKTLGITNTDMRSMLDGKAKAKIEGEE